MGRNGRLARSGSFAPGELPPLQGSRRHPPDHRPVPGKRVATAGGPGIRRGMHNRALVGWIRQASERPELVLSVCTGALLVKAGLPDGLEATMH